MQKFLFKFLCLTALVSLLFIFFINTYRGNIDYFYNHFTKPKQFSLIIGESRAKSGIVPQVLNVCLKNTNYKKPIYNFSFTISQTYYGPSFLESIKRKLNTESNKQLFIIQLSPWIFSKKSNETIEESNFNLLKKPPHNMVNLNSNPNFEYIIKNFNHFNFKGFFKKNYVLTDDGHSEDNIFPGNDTIFQKNKKNQIDLFLRMEKKYSKSKYRIRWFNKTIQYLQNYGSIIFVRMPFDKDFLEIENRYWPEFDAEIEKIAQNNKITYLNYSQQSHWSSFTFDGHHLDKHKDGAKLFSQQLCNDILFSTNN